MHRQRTIDALGQNWLRVNLLAEETGLRWDEWLGRRRCSSLGGLKEEWVLSIHPRRTRRERKKLTGSFFVSCGSAFSTLPGDGEN